MTDASITLDAPSSVVRLPSAALFDDVVETLRPSIADIAARKCIPLTEDDHIPLLTCALCGISRREMRRLLTGDSVAVQRVARAINHTLDLFMATRFASAVLVMQGRENEPIETVIAIAEASLKEKAANDREEPLRVWSNFTDAAVWQYAQLRTHDYATVVVTLPNGLKPTGMVEA